MRFSAPEIITHRTRKINVINGHSLKFSESTMKNYFTQPTKTTYSPTKNIKGSKHNPTIKVTDEINPVMTSIDSVVLKSDRGRRIRSYLSQDINSYIDATTSKKSLPSSVVSTIETTKTKSKLLKEFHSYTERELIPQERAVTPTRDLERQASRLQEIDVRQPNTDRLKKTNATAGAAGGDASCAGSNE
jgi:hypothetical protein